MFSGLGIREDQIQRIFSTCFSVAVKKAMDAKLCLCLMLIILGTLTVQGAIPNNKEENPLEVFARDGRSECFFDPCMSPFYNFINCVVGHKFVCAVISSSP